MSKKVSLSPGAIVSNLIEKHATLNFLEKNGYQVPAGVSSVSERIFQLRKEISDLQHQLDEEVWNGGRK